MMDINWRQEYEAAVIERNGLIMALMAAEARAKAAEVIASAPDKVIDNMTTVISERIAAEARIAELEARLAGEAWRSVQCVAQGVGAHRRSGGE